MQDESAHGIKTNDYHVSTFADPRYATYHDELIDLVEKGKKRATAHMQLDFEKNKVARRVPGDGGGNVGLIAGYHALQAGIGVVGLCEAMPECGGYKVHKDKLVRMGVPVYVPALSDSEMGLLVRRLERDPELRAAFGRYALLGDPEHALIDAMPRPTVVAGSAYLKISEGCNHRCTFCIIPSMRGDLASRPIGEVMLEAERLVKAGVKELLVISQDTSAYGVDVRYKLDFVAGRAEQKTYRLFDGRGNAEIIQRHGVDLLVVGAHGHKGFTDWLYGSTIDELRHRLNISVLVAGKAG